MKRLIVLCAVFVLFLSNSKADDFTYTDDSFYDRLLEKRLKVPDTKTYMEYLKVQLGKMQTMSDEEVRAAGSEEFWLERIKKIPPEYMEYYAPALFSNSAVPDSVLNRPEIKKYKGRLPKKIAPEVYDIVKKYGNDISPDYYYLLMPEIYDKFNKNKNQDKKEIKTKMPTVEYKVSKDNAGKIIKSNKPSKYIDEKMKLIDENMDFITGKIINTRSKTITNNSKITDRDVLEFINTIVDIRMITEREENIPVFNSAKFEFDKDDDNCKIFIKRFQATKLKDDVLAVLKSHGFDLNSFENICRRTFVAASFSDLDLNKVNSFYNYAVMAKITGKKIDDYSVNLDDYKAVFPYRKLLYKSLINDMFIVGHKK